ncbi:MAG: AAA family ATPase [Saprospiraceae bacterium]|nr:AAA family ATPase [Saprospiraceae bacterium]
MSIVSGKNEFLGFPINARHRSVIYVSTEDLERETAFLLSRQTQSIKAEQLANLRFIFSIEGLLKELDTRLDRKPADLVIIDCFSDAYGGDLKDTQKIRSYLHPFQELAGKYDCLFLFLHHTGKRTENLEPSKNNLLSGQGFEAKMRLVIELRADQFDPMQRHFCIVKGNYLPANIKKESYLLSFDENTFLFENSGERVPFEMLVKNPNSDNRKEKFFQALKLQNEGLNYDQIAKKLDILIKVRYQNCLLLENH